MSRFVLKLFVLVLFALPFWAYAFTVPERPTGFVEDYANLLTPEQATALESKLVNFEKSTTNEIAVVTIPALDGDIIENVAQEIFTKWGIGKADKNNGVLLLVSLADRQTRIHTGYGVEGDLTDIGTAYIQDEVIKPAFQNGDYSAGINGAIDKMIEALRGADIVPADYSASTSDSSDSSGWWQFAIFGIILVFQILVAILGRSKSWWFGGVLGGGIGLALWYFFISSLMIAIPAILALTGFGLLFDFLVSRAHQRKETSGSYPWWFGGGRGGFGGGGGGFGGFGGGMSGGGGSSGRW